MQFYSTNNKSVRADFREATIIGQPSDKGLFFPERIPLLSPSFLQNIDGYSNEEIALEVIRTYVGDSIPSTVLLDVVAQTVNFPFPLVPVREGISTLELFHGPTLAFKDVGARFMSRCLGYFNKNNKKEVTVLVATSGDTGGAVASGFYGVEGIEVVILYPSGKVSSVQEQQLTSWGGNIKVIEVSGDFDDCQRMVKDAFADHRLLRHKQLTSANSINVARWLPQQFYYFYAWQQWKDKNDPPVIAVPSGNFGNICAGLLAEASGLPVKKFIAACNANDTVPRYLQTSAYQPQPTVATLSNAMDVSAPSNFIRILELFRGQDDSLKESMVAMSFTDEETTAAIKSVWDETGYLMDPHGAVGYCALKRYRVSFPDEKGYFLETAHPVKFYNTVETIIGKKIPVPDAVAGLKKEKPTVKMKPKYEELMVYLMST